METIEKRNGQSAEPANGSAGDYRRVRELLLGGEQRKLNFLHHHLQEIQQHQAQLEQRCQKLHANEVELAQQINHLLQRGDGLIERHLPSAILRRLNDSETSRQELVNAFQIPVEESLRNSANHDPDRLRTALGPVITPEVNRTLWEAFQESGLRKLVRFRPDGSAGLAWPVAILFSVMLIFLTGWLVYSIKENLGLARANEALRAEVGFAITSAENPPLEKPRFTGLRDPLAPDPVEVLRNAGLNPTNFSVDLQPYQSIDTPYAYQREQDRVRELEELRKQMVNAIGDLTTANETDRGRDRETFARALFAMRFPEVTDKVTFEYRDDRCFLNGSVEEPLYSELIDGTSNLFPTGDVDTSGLQNATELDFTRLKADIEATGLLFLPGETELSEAGAEHADQLVTLIGELDAVAGKLGREPVSFAVHALPDVNESEFNESLEIRRIEATNRLLINKVRVRAERILSGIHAIEPSPDRPGIYLEIVEPEI